MTLSLCLLLRSIEPRTSFSFSFGNMFSFSKLGFSDLEVTKLVEKAKAMWPIGVSTAVALFATLGECNIDACTVLLGSITCKYRCDSGLF
jgi:hypothetical protein